MSEKVATLNGLQILDFDVLSKMELWTSALLKKPPKKGDQRDIESPVSNARFLLGFSPHLWKVKHNRDVQTLQKKTKQSQQMQ